MRFSAISHWFRRRKKPPKHFKAIRVVAKVSDVPLDAGRDFFIVRREGRDIWAVFQCPCAKRHQLQVNLSQQKTPFWECMVRNGEVSLSPSVWLNYECNSHFWVTESRIYWFTAARESKKKQSQQSQHS